MICKFKSKLRWLFLGVTIACSSVKALDAVTDASSKPKKYQLSVCAVFKNEANYLKEWIEYHRLVGVDHFYLYNCESTDTYLRELKPYLQKGIVTLVKWHDPCPDQKDCPYLWALTTQVPAYENAARYRAAKETKWLVFLNIDEFLVPMHGGRLTDVLERYEEYPGITLSSEWYEAYNVGREPARRLVIETIELTADPHEHPQMSTSKTIFKPDLCTAFTWPPYRCAFQGNQVALELGRDELRINRYLNRFKGFLNYGKHKEKLAVNSDELDEKEKYQLLEMGYEIDDQERVIYQYVPEVRDRLSK